MASGVKLDPECVNAFNNFKLGKADAYLLFGFSDDAKKIIVLHREPKTAGGNNGHWDKFIESLPAEDVRYAVVDVDLDAKRTEMTFVTWAPESAPIKRRMLMASSKDVIKNALLGCKKQIQATCYPDLDLRSVLDNFKSVH